MIRNSGKITKTLYNTTTSAISGANGVYDTFDAYNARLNNIWPITVVHSKTISAATTMVENTQYTVTNTSEFVTANTTLYYTLENLSGTNNELFGLFQSINGSFTQTTAQTGSFTLTPASITSLNPTRQPITFRIQIRTTSITGPVVNTSSTITIPVPIATVQFENRGAGDGSNETTDTDKILTITWANVGLYNNGNEKIYNIAWSGTANTTTDFNSTLSSEIYALGNTAYTGETSSIVPKTDLLTEGTETLIGTVLDPDRGNAVLGTATFTISDTSRTPVTTITSSKTIVEEGTSVRLDVTMTDPSYSTVYYFITGSGATKFASQTGNFLLSSGGITLTPVNNFVDGDTNTTFQVQFRVTADSSSYLYGTSPVITITDPAEPSATISAATSINEGTTNQFIVNTTNADGIALVWTITSLSGTLTTTDFLTGITGIVTAVSGTGTINVNPRADTFTESTETFRLTVALPNSTVLATHDFIVSDTSTGTTEPIDLYAFSTFRFLPGTTSITGTAAVNYSGDSLSTFLSTFYNTTTYPWLSSTSNYNVITAGIQQWTVPITGLYQFTVAGAQGGAWLGGAANGWGGGGLILNGNVFLTKNTVLNIVVGKAGGLSGNTATGGGGGGGTFVYTGAIGGTGLIFAAGGGGGADDSAVDGQSARTDYYAGTNSAAIRTNPLDGNGSTYGGGGGSGTGWLSASTGTGAGTRFTGGLSLSPGGVGGFGGGGGDQDDGGGGGGYTGGTSTTATSGGAGGSYANLMLAKNVTASSLNRTLSASSSLSGYVEVTLLNRDITAVITPSISTIAEGQNIVFNIVTSNFTSGSLPYYLLTNTGGLRQGELTSTTGTVSIVDSIGQVSFSFTNDLITEGDESFSLVLYSTTNNVNYIAGTSSAVTVQDTSTGTAETFSTQPSYISIGSSNTPELGAGAYSVIDFPRLTDWTVLLNASTDDSFVTVPALPFEFKIDNTKYTNVFVGTNAYITFGAGSNSQSFGTSIAASVLPIPKLIWTGGDNSAQRVLYRVDPLNRFVNIRYEGTSSTSGTVGSSGIVAEIKLFNSKFTRGISTIEIRYRTTRIGSTSSSLSLSSASAYYASTTSTSAGVQYSFVFYATNLAATAWTLVGGGSGVSAVVTI